MIEVNGYVFIANFSEFKFLFGKSKNNQDRIYENLETNGITAYTTVMEAEGGAQEFVGKMSRVKEGSTAKLEMKIAEDLKDLKKLKEESSLIVIMIYEEFKKKIESLYGPIIDNGKRYSSLPGAVIYCTNFKTFTHTEEYTAFERAMHLAEEIRRQGNLPVRIATFKLEKII